MKRFVIVGAAVLGMLFAAYIILYRSSVSNTYDIAISEASVSVISVSQRTGRLTLKLNNKGEPQTLVSVTSGDAASARIMGVEDSKAAIVPGGGSASLASDGAHVVLEGIDGSLEEGRLINIGLVLEPAGEINTKARLVSDRPMDHGNHSQMMEMSDAETGGAAGHKGKHHMVPDGEPKPSLSVKVSPGENGWQLNTETSNFEFSRELADGEHVGGTGHGHIYLNGLKLGRLYANTASIGVLPKGKHIVRVTLNTNDHKAYMVDGKMVTAATEIIVE